MKGHLIDINNLVVTDQSIHYNFMCEMYPVIEELYNRLWFLENLAILKDEVKTKKIEEVKKSILTALASCEIPDNILFLKKEGNLYIEPITNMEFRIPKTVEYEDVSDEYAEFYIKLYKNNLFFKSSIPKFKELTKTRYKKR